MSRIHEALRKAGMERAAGQPADPVVAQRYLRGDEGTGSQAVATESLQKNEAVTVTTNNGGEFKDMVLRCAHSTWRPDPQGNVFSPNQSWGLAEQFRMLRSRLYHMRGNQKLCKVLITSPMAGDGKTFVTSNLAYAIARQADRRVLIIDADMRRPRMHVPLGAPSSPGLSDYLQGEKDESAVIQRGNEGNLYFIASGSVTTNPTELISNNRLKQLLDCAAGYFDWVILDSPPCLPVADAGILAGSCDGTVLVVRANTTPAPTARKACEQLRKSALIGVVLNDVQESALGYHHASYYGSGNGSASAAKD